MFYLKNLLIETLSGFIIVIPFLILFQIINRKRNVSYLHIIGTYIYSLYIFAVLSITGIPFLNGINMSFTINFIPFIDLANNFTQYILNLILFIPFGFLLPFLWTKYQKFKTTFLSGLLFSMSIEISQLFCFRTTDIDDLIMNTLGTIIGYIFFLILKRTFKFMNYFTISTNCSVNNTFSKYEALIYLLIVYLIMFFLQPILSEWIWNLFLL